MRGYTPTQLLVASATAASDRVRRWDALATRVRAAIGVEAIRFRDGVPAYLVHDAVVLDPVAGRFLDGEGLRDDWPDTLAAALAPQLSTRCTCAAPTTIGASLVPIENTGEALSMPADGRVAIVFSVSCAHDTRVPPRREWEDAGMTIDGCLQAWRDGVGAAEWRVAAVDDGPDAIVHGADAAAIAADERLSAGLAAACGFPRGADVSILAVATNVVLVVAAADEAALAALAEPLDLSALDAEGFPPGERVSLVRRTRAADAEHATFRLTGFERGAMP
jgi:hypothetical protein